MARKLAASERHGFRSSFPPATKLKSSHIVANMIATTSTGLVASLLLAAAPAPSSAPNDSAFTAARSDPLSRVCGPGQDDRSSDLCAQWKAADAAADAAWWARFGGLATIISLLAVALATYETIRANRIAREAMQRQLRAYVSVSEFEIRDLTVGKTPWVSLTFRNDGQTPAYNVRQRCFVEPFGDQIPDNCLALSNPSRAKPAPVVSPGGVFSVHPWLGSQWTSEQQAEFDAGRLKVFTWGDLQYVDAFGSERMCTWRAYHSRDVKGSSFFDCDEGNASN